MTAAAIARVRSHEGTRPASERLFEDPYAALFDDTHVDVQQMFDLIPFFEQHVRLRTRFFDDAVRLAVTRGATHVVLVGAGFDMRARRMPELAPPMRVIEVDHGDQIAAKQQKLAAAGVAPAENVAFARADLLEEGALARGLRSAGLGAPVKALWICEGLLGYLSLPAIAALAATTAQFSLPGSQLVANHNVYSWSPAAIAEPFQAAGYTVSPPPRYVDLHRKWIGDADDSAGSDFAFLVADR
jgi:methyltransferase (TIGR00027 family)